MPHRSSLGLFCALHLLVCAIFLPTADAENGIAPIENYSPSIVEEFGPEAAKMAVRLKVPALKDIALWTDLSGARLNSYRSQTLDIYLSSGDRDELWDEHAIFGLALYARSKGNWRATAGRAESYQSAAALKKALELGCRDPMVIYAALRIEKTQKIPATILLHSEKHWGWQSPLFDELIAASEKAAYPPQIKASFYLRASQASWLTQNSGPTLKRQGHLAKQSLKFLATAAPQVARDRFARQDWHSRAFVAVNLLAAVPGENIESCLEDFVSELEKTPGVDPAMALSLCGQIYVNIAWAKRTSRRASEVTQEGWAGFAEYLTKAKTVLEMAAELQPVDIHTHESLMPVALGASDSELSEKSFLKARELDPDASNIYTQRMALLLPKWGGSEAAVIEFGRQCASPGQPSKMMGTQLSAAHRAIAKDTIDPRHGHTVGLKAHFDKRPSDLAEVLDYFERHLAEYPEDHYSRCKYIILLTDVAEKETAVNHIELLGDNLVRSVISPVGLTTRRQRLGMPPKSYLTADEESRIADKKSEPLAKAGSMIIPVPARIAPDEEAEAIAKNLVTTFTSAKAAGAADFDRARTAREACIMLRQGVTGSDSFQDTVFQIQAINDQTLERAMNYIAWDATNATLLFLPSQSK